MVSASAHLWEGRFGRPLLVVRLLLVYCCPLCIQCPCHGPAICCSCAPGGGVCLVLRCPGLELHRAAENP